MRPRGHPACPGAAGPSTRKSKGSCFWQIQHGIYDLGEASAGEVGRHRKGVGRDLEAVGKLRGEATEQLRNYPTLRVSNFLTHRQPVMLDTVLLIGST